MDRAAAPARRKNLDRLTEPKTKWGSGWQMPLTDDQIIDGINTSGFPLWLACREQFLQPIPAGTALQFSPWELLVSEYAVQFAGERSRIDLALRPRADSSLKKDLAMVVEAKRHRADYKTWAFLPPLQQQGAEGRCVRATLDGAGAPCIDFVTYGFPELQDARVASQAVEVALNRQGAHATTEAIEKTCLQAELGCLALAAESLRGQQAGRTEDPRYLIPAIVTTADLRLVEYGSRDVNAQGDLALAQSTLMPVDYVYLDRSIGVAPVQHGLGSELPPYSQSIRKRAEAFRIRVLVIRFDWLREFVKRSCSGVTLGG